MPGSHCEFVAKSLAITGPEKALGCRAPLSTYAIRTRQRWKWFTPGIAASSSTKSLLVITKRLGDVLTTVRIPIMPGSKVWASHFNPSPTKTSLTMRSSIDAGLLVAVSAIAVSGGKNTYLTRQVCHSNKAIIQEKNSTWLTIMYGHNLCDTGYTSSQTFHVRMYRDTAGEVSIIIWGRNNWLNLDAFSNSKTLNQPKNHSPVDDS